VQLRWRPAGAAAADVPARSCDRGPHESGPGVQRAYRGASHIRWHCAIVRCCSDPHRFESNAPRLLSSTACRAGYIPTSAICTNAPASRLIADSRATFAHRAYTVKLIVTFLSHSFSKRAKRPLWASSIFPLAIRQFSIEPQSQPTVRAM
jgi:hypothetical protein